MDKTKQKLGGFQRELKAVQWGSVLLLKIFSFFRGGRRGVPHNFWFQALFQGKNKYFYGVSWQKQGVNLSLILLIFVILGGSRIYPLNLGGSRCLSEYLGGVYIKIVEIRGGQCFQVTTNQFEGHPPGDVYDTFPKYNQFYGKNSGSDIYSILFLFVIWGIKNISY